MFNKKKSFSTSANILYLRRLLGAKVANKYITIVYKRKQFYNFACENK